tara:strand:+ start:5171 stop:6109 length:939 start_codon:yes stop_codon:yes gene_type:complete
MKVTNDQFLALLNRIEKRFKYLNKWAAKNNIEYFRIFDRDLPDAPVMIDVLPDHWLVWLCDHHFDNTMETSLLDTIKSKLIQLKKSEVVIKNRKKNNIIKQTFFEQGKSIIVKEGGLNFKLNLTRYLDTGLFIDHRRTREYVLKHAKGKRVLNLFAYTGSFSCYALQGGANFVTSVDLNPTYSEWHEENCKLNGFSKKRYSILTADVIPFLKSNKSKYDVIICDPPTFSQSKRKQVKTFHIQDDAQTLLELCNINLKNGGEIIFSTNFKKFDFEELQNTNAWTMKEYTKMFCSKDFEGKWMSRCFLVKPQFP